MPRFAANLTLMFDEYPFLERFAAAAKAGFEAVEFQFPYDHTAEAIAEAARGSNLPVVLINLPPGDWAAGDRGLAALPERRQDFEGTLATALRYADILAVPRLHVMAGLVPADDPAARSCFVDNLRLASERAATAGRTVVIEPLNERDVPGYFLRDFDQAASIIKDVRRPNIGLMFDIYHRQIIHGDVLRGLEELMPLIGHVQIAAAPSRTEPGSGELHDGFILRALDRLGYEGFVGCEYRPAGETLAGLSWLREISGKRPDINPSGS